MICSSPFAESNQSASSNQEEEEEAHVKGEKTKNLRTYPPFITYTCGLDSVLNIACGVLIRVADEAISLKKCWCKTAKSSD